MSVYDAFEFEVYDTPCLVQITHYSEEVSDTFNDQGDLEELHWVVLTLEGRSTGVNEDTMTGSDWQSVYDACKKHIEQVERESEL